MQFGVCSVISLVTLGFLHGVIDLYLQQINIKVSEACRIVKNAY
jgi:hypothetical protein